MSESLKKVDEEIKRLAKEIAQIQHTSSSPKKVGSVKPDYSKVPSIDVEMPKGFPRAPVTHPYDPAKAEKLAKCQSELRDALLGKNRIDTVALLSRIHRHQAAHPVRFTGAGPASRPTPMSKEDPTRDHVLSNLIGPLGVRNSS